MRRVLLLGGTGWLGREVARAAVASGAEVVCIARGESGQVPDGARLVSVDRRSVDAYASLGGDWDDVLEFSHDASLVGPALEALADRAKHWTLVSSVSVYARDDEPGADESATLVEPEHLESYPDAKAHAEGLSAARIAERLLIVRPGLIVGPGDPSDRFGYWPARLARGGRVLVPQVAGRHAQVVDVADLARWLVLAGAARVTGPVNAVGPAEPLERVIRAVSAVVHSTAELVAADDATLLARDVRYWAGPRSLPLWLPLTSSGFAQRDGSAFLRLGGVVRPLSETIARVYEDELRRGVDRIRRSGLSPTEEGEVLDTLPAG